MILKNVKLINDCGVLYLLIDEIDENGYCAFSMGGGLYIRKYAETYDLLPDWIMGIIAYPEQIGLVFERELYGGVCLLSPFNNYYLLEIEKNNGFCKIEIQKPLHHDKNDIHPKDVKIEPVLVDNKVVIHLS